MKTLAARADEKWAAKESFLDAPARQQPEPAIGVRDPGGYVAQSEPERNEGVKSAVEEPEKVVKVAEGEQVDEGRFKGATKEKPRRQREEAPWAKEKRGGPDEQFAPQAWTPGPAARR
jgi:NADH dehydrogenase [ubiquinone] 1 alpha subcomplex assembly factor 2